jgi:hypothetical protein
LPIPAFREDGWLPVGHYPVTWDEVITHFGGGPKSKRAMLTRKLLTFRDRLRSCGCVGRMVLDGSFISARTIPGDFDMLLVLQPNIQQMKDSDPYLSRLLDAEMSENRDGYSVFYAPENSSAIGFLLPMWDKSKEGVAKGVVEVEI